MFLSNFQFTSLQRLEWGKKYNISRAVSVFYHNVDDYLRAVGAFNPKQRGNKLARSQQKLTDDQCATQEVCFHRIPLQYFYTTKHYLSLLYWLLKWTSQALIKLFKYVSWLESSKLSRIPHEYMSRDMTKSTKWHVRPVKTRISLGIRPVWPESSVSAWRKLGSLATHWAHSEDWSDWADIQADMSLRWAHSHFLGFVMSRLIFSNHSEY